VTGLVLYSNGADRMKLVLTAPEKSSIPGAVQLVEIDGILTIVPEDTAIANGWRSQYHVIYDYIDDTSPVFTLEQTLEHIYELANQQTGEQGRIAISKEILDKIENFRQMILADEVT
jgi:hypothetical protein